MIKKISSIIKNLYSLLTVFDIDVNEQKRYLMSFDEPKDDIERSFYQYKCQLRLNKGRFRSVVLNFFSFFILLPFVLVFIVKGFFRSKVSNITKKGTVFIDQGIHDFLPETVKEAYQDITVVPFSNDKWLNGRDVKLCLELYFRYLSHSFFALKAIYKIALYRAIIDVYNPHTIIVASEYSYTSSILTYLCEKNGVFHVNVMHGEKLFYIRDSFFRFNRCYVWENHYATLFVKLRAYPNQFELAFPSVFKLQVENQNAISSKYALTYYLGAEELEELTKIRDNLKSKFVDIHRIAIRPHPRHAPISLVTEIFDGFAIENPTQVSISKSILNTDALCSLFSTVLYQGKINNKQVLIDDISDSEKYKMLMDLDYCLISQPHEKLSGIVPMVNQQF